MFKLEKIKFYKQPDKKYLINGGIRYVSNNYWQ